MLKTPEFNFMIVEVEHSIGLEKSLELETLFRVLDATPDPDAPAR